MHDTRLQDKFTEYWMHVGRWILRIFSTSQAPARVILKNVSWFTGEKDLKFHFGRFGKVQHVKLLYDWKTGLHRGFAFVIFESIDDAIRAVQQRNHHINGRKVVAKIAISSESNRNRYKGVRRNSTELFVKKISWVTGALQLKDHFSQFGKVTNITLPFDLRTGLHKGFAFISFENNDFYQNIRKFKGKHIIDDEEIICSLSSKQKSLSTVINATPVDCESNSEIDFSKANHDNEVETVAFIEIAKTRETKVKCEINPELIPVNDMNFQNCKVRTDETNLLPRKLQKTDVPKERSRKNSHFEKAVVSAKFRNLVTEDKGDSGTANKKAYTEVRPLRMNIAKNGFSGWIGSPNRNFGVLATENTKQKCLENESNS